MRTYLPLVVKLCLTFCRTLRRYEVQIKKDKTTEFKNLFDAAMVACQALEVAAAALLPAAGE
jgi:hypothetical protein